MRCDAAESNGSAFATRKGRRWPPLGRFGCYRLVAPALLFAVNPAAHALHELLLLARRGVGWSGLFTLGGSADENASIGDIIGPAFSYDDVVDGARLDSAVTATASASSTREKAAKSGWLHFARRAHYNSPPGGGRPRIFTDQRG